MANRIQLRRGSAAEWALINPILAQGEAGYELDTGKLKIGDGITRWNSLPYFASEASNIPTALSDLTNDTGFITSEDIPTALSAFTNDTGFVSAIISSTPPVSPDIGDFWIDSTDMSLNVWHNDGSITQWVELTGSQSGDIPTALSELTNDTGFITSEDIPTALSAFTNDPGYVTSAEVPDITALEQAAINGSSIKIASPRDSNFSLLAADNNYLIPVGAEVVVTIPADIAGPFVVILMQNSNTPFSFDIDPQVIVNQPQGLIPSFLYDTVALIKTSDNNFLAIKADQSLFLSGMNDVDFAELNDGQAMSFDGNSGKWVNIDAYDRISRLEDVEIVDIADSQILTYDGSRSKWVNSTISSSNVGSTTSAYSCFSNPLWSPLGHILGNFSANNLGDPCSYDMTVDGLITIYWPGHGMTAAQNGMSITIKNSNTSTNRLTNPLGISENSAVYSTGYFIEWATNFTYIDSDSFTCQANLTPLPLAQAVSGVSLGPALTDSFSCIFRVTTPPLVIPANSMGPNGEIKFKWAFQNQKNFNSDVGTGLGFGYPGWFSSMQINSIVWNGSNGSGTSLMSTHMSSRDTRLRYDGITLNNMNNTARQMRVGTDVLTQGSGVTSLTGLENVTTQWDTTQEMHCWVGGSFNTNTETAWTVVWNLHAVTTYGA